MKKITFLFVIFFAYLSNAENVDPLEDFNRPIFEFNQSVDENILKPIAISYKEKTPESLKKAISNFFSNLEDVSTLVNQILQLKLEDGFTSFSRVAINSTFGLAGIFDPASDMGLSKKDEDFGQTLGTWGVSSGPYLVIPLIGPSTVRDASGMYVDMSSDYNLTNKLDSNGEIAAVSIGTIDKRVQLLPVTELINRSFDPYTTIRSSYLQKRRNDVSDGVNKNKSLDF